MRVYNIELVEDEKIKVIAETKVLTLAKEILSSLIENEINERVNFQISFFEEGSNKTFVLT